MAIEGLFETTQSAKEHGSVIDMPLVYCNVSVICIAVLEVHNSKKRFQCERLREKIAVLKERKEALAHQLIRNRGIGSPVNKEERVGA